MGQEKKDSTFVPLAKKVYTTNLLQKNESIKLDGKLDEKHWDKVSWGGDFIEWLPDENTKPTEKTTFKILYDENNIYVGIRCFDSDPKKIGKWMSRRDGFEGDWVQIHFDSYHDLRTSFSFTVSASGVKGDEIVSNNGDNWDASWNPIWYVKTSIDDKGWVAEMKIPLSQLRFGKRKDQIWGLQINRDFFREDSFWVWQRKPIDTPGWVSEFGELHGLNNLTPQNQLEIQPFSVYSYDVFPKEDGNPFKTGREEKLNLGLDAKIGVTNDLTLDLTMNPDFGQVEADPSAIALDGFQIFFREQRPFFLENKNIFDYNFSTSRTGNTFASDNLFYSRRIGRSPQRSANLMSNEFADSPENTTILGAAKFSGKTRNGWSIGVLESITSKEEANIVHNDNNKVISRKEIVEPFTNYFVSRIQKDFNNNNTFIGGIFTATNRNLNLETDFLHKSAYTGGLDIKHQWKNRSWYFNGNFVFSNVNGSKEAILRTQQSQTHLFQRIGSSHVNVNPSLTSLTGTGGNIQIGKQGAGKWRFESGVTWRSPKLELNDVGFQRQSDEVRYYGMLRYRILKPNKIFRSFNVAYKHFAVWDFGGNLNQIAMRINSSVTFNNNWTAGVNIGYFPFTYSNFALRGGPRFRFSTERGVNINLGTDIRKKLRLTLGGSHWRPSDNSWSFNSLEAGVSYRPINSLQLSLSSSFSDNDNHLQFVENVLIDNAQQSIMARIIQKTLNFSLRINYNLNPNLTLQYWGQPFISRGKYSNFKYITNASDKVFENRFDSYNTSQVIYDSPNNRYSFDQNEDGTEDFNITNPDFSFVQFRSNLVLRWEYIPGSEIFLVWSQNLSEQGDLSNSLFNDLKGGISRNQISNTFLIKATYRFRL